MVRINILAVTCFEATIEALREIAESLNKLHLDDSRRPKGKSEAHFHVDLCRECVYLSAKVLAVTVICGYLVYAAWQVVQPTEVDLPLYSLRNDAEPS